MTVFYVVLLGLAVLLCSWLAGREGSNEPFVDKDLVDQFGWGFWIVGVTACLIAKIYELSEYFSR